MIGDVTTHAQRLNQISPSGSWVKVWDATTGQVEKTLEAHSYGLKMVAFSLEGRQIVSGSRDKTVKVWDAAVQWHFHRMDDRLVGVLTTDEIFEI
jgi:WD40 repeat protein